MEIQTVFETELIEKVRSINFSSGIISSVGKEQTLDNFSSSFKQVKVLNHKMNFPITLKYDSLSALPTGALVGTASLRRQSQLLWKYPELKCVNFRGNVQSRIRKLKEEVVDCTLLALAGLKRMDLTEHATKILDFEDMLPAVAQGAIGIQCRSDDEVSLKYIKGLNHEPTKLLHHIRTYVHSHTHTKHTLTHQVRDNSRSRFHKKSR